MKGCMTLREHEYGNLSVLKEVLFTKTVTMQHRLYITVTVTVNHQKIYF